MPIIMKKSKPLNTDDRSATLRKRSHAWSIAGIVVGVLLLGAVVVAIINRLSTPPPLPATHFRAVSGQGGGAQEGGTGGTPGRPGPPEQIRRYGPEFIEAEREALYGPGYGNKP